MGESVVVIAAHSRASRKGSIFMRRRRAAGGLESEVLATLWAADKPLSVGQVMDTLEDDLAYNTVHTILTRLHAKGAVGRELVGRAHVYTAVLDDAGIAANRMHAVLDKGGDEAAVLSHFVESLTAEQEAMLAKLLRRGGR